MNIAVAGCGITGTAAAYFLAKAGHQVTIFEQAKQCGPVGAGIMLQPSGQAVLRSMGLLEPIESCSARLEGMTAKLVSGKNLVQLKYADLSSELYGIGAHRGRLFQLLYQACEEAGVTICTGARVCGYESLDKGKNKKVRLLFESPEEEPKLRGEFDFVIGADGSLSALRDHLCRQEGLKSRTIEYDYAALWMTTRTEYRSDQLVQVVNGTQELVGILPIGPDECSFFWGLKADEHQQLILASFSDWRDSALRTCPEAEPLLADKMGFEEFTFARYRHVKTNRPHGARAILLGDAAHATSPHLGQGANLGLEDAALFAEALAETGNEFHNACLLFAKRRSRQVRFYQSLTRILTPFFQSRGTWKGVARNLFLPWFPTIPFVRRQMLRTLCGLKKGWLG